MMWHMELKLLYVVQGLKEKINMYYMYYMFLALLTTHVILKCTDDVAYGAEVVICSTGSERTNKYVLYVLYAYGTFNYTCYLEVY